jgi:GntR family transcriptional regulator/MocR family aminotransferase
MFLIDRQATEQIYHQLYRQLRAEIETGVRQPGQVVPSTRYLAQQLSLSRNTVDHAYQDLVAEGYLVSRPGSGYHVANQLPFAVASPALSAVPRPKYRYDFTETYDYLRLFPVQAWQAAEQRVFQRGVAHIQPANGDLGYREQLVNYLARLKNLHVQPEQIVITSGFNEAAGIIAQLVPAFHDQGLSVAEPIAPNARSVWQTLAVPVTQFRELANLPDSAGYVLSPTHNFPSGAGLTAIQRQKLAAWLQERQRYLIELDTDGNLTYSGQPTPAIHHYLDGERCFYYTNFDEILGASLCMGILVIPENLIGRYQVIYGKLPNRNSQLQQQVLSQLIANDDLERFMRQLTIVYANRRQLVLNTVRDCFGSQVEAMDVAAGSFVTLRLHLKQPVKTLIAAAEQVGVGLVDPDRCWSNLQPAYPSIVLSLRQMDDAHIVDGIRALADAWQQFLV